MVFTFYHKFSYALCYLLFISTQIDWFGIKTYKLYKNARKNGSYLGMVPEELLRGY